MTITSTEQLPEGICVLADGGCKGNNRPVAEREMYGSITVFHKRAVVESTRVGKRQAQHHLTYCSNDWHNWASNNLAELLAMYDALDYLWLLSERDSVEHPDRKLTVTVVSDSEFAIGYADGTFKPNSKTHTSLLNARLMLHGMIDRLKARGMQVTFQHADNGWVKSILGH